MDYLSSYFTVSYHVKIRNTDKKKCLKDVVTNNLKTLGIDAWKTDTKLICVEEMVNDCCKTLK